MTTLLILSRKQALMPLSTLKRHEPRELANRSGTPSRAGLDRGSPRATRSEADDRRFSPADDTHPDQQPVPEATVMTSAEPDEELVADPRAGLTPSQVVDRRLLALLGSGNPGLYVQASGRPGGVRRQTGE
jgi:hypothetical protein